MNIQAKVALDKERHPERYCPVRRCLWRTGDGSHCPRHGAPPDIVTPAGALWLKTAGDDPAYLDRERMREAVGGELW